MIRKLKDQRQPHAAEAELPTTGDAPPDTQVPVRFVLAAVLGLFAAWTAAGSVGLVAPPLQHAMTWLALGAAAIAAWPKKLSGREQVGIVLGGVGLGIALVASQAAVVGGMAVVLVIASLAYAADGTARRTLAVGAWAAFALAIWRLACIAFPVVWLAADAMGRATGLLFGQPLSIGATMAGLDFLVLMAALFGVWLIQQTPPRRGRAIVATAAIIVGHGVYLFVLSHWIDWADALPVAPPPGDPDIISRYVPPPWHWAEALQALLPWNLPLLAAAIHCSIAAVMLRRANWRATENAAQDLPATKRAQLPAWLRFAPIAVALLLPMAAMLCGSRSDLPGKKIVAYERGYLNWDKPAQDRFGRRATGLYGMLPTLVASLGGEFQRSPELGATDLEDADVLVLIHPTDRWGEHPERLEAIWNFVCDGGSLLVLAEPSVLQEDGAASSFSELLDSTAIQVRVDTAIPATAAWRHCLQPLPHPAVAGIDEARNGFALAQTSSLRIAWPARPLLTARWGFSDPGSDAMLTGVWRIDQGERLGDLVLAAEQRIGRGTVVVLGDTSSLTNEFAADSYPLVARLFGYLASPSGNPQSLPRQALAMLLLVALVGLLAWRPGLIQLGGAALAIAVGILIVAAIHHNAAGVVPASVAVPVALIDASHLEAFDDNHWSDDGIAGLKLTLVRNGYLPVLARKLTSERLARASLLLSVAPSRPFSASEQQAIGEFVDRGGSLIVMAGAERAGAVNPLLSQYGLRVPPSPLPATAAEWEPLPMGNFSALYASEGSQEKVVFHAGWPIEVRAGQAQTLVQGFDGQPVVAESRAGSGRVVVIGDSEFAMNKNLEDPEGRENETSQLNARFWQWLLDRIQGEAAKETQP